MRSIFFSASFYLCTYVFGQSPTFLSHTLAEDISFADGSSKVKNIDFDGDGDLDIISASKGSHKFLWFENKLEDGFETHIIAENIEYTNGARDLEVVDFDGDGTLDIIGVCRRGDMFVWFKNGGSNEFEPIIINDDDSNGAFAVEVGDVNLDGELDIVTASMWERNLVWYNNMFESHIIDDQCERTTALDLADFDLDGDLDLVAGGNHEKGLVMYVNDGVGNFSSSVPLLKFENASVSWNTIDHYDINEDGRMDIIAAGHHYLALLLQNEDGSFISDSVGTYEQVFGAETILAYDVDEDGDQDLIAGTTNHIQWYENDGSENFTNHIISEVHSNSLGLGDFNNDSFIDLSNASENSFTLVENDGLNFYSLNSIESRISAFDGAFDLEIIDINNDEIPDVLGIENKSFSVHINDGNGTFSSSSVSVESNLNYDIAAGDLNGDQKPEILVSGIAENAPEGQEIIIIYDGNDLSTTLITLDFQPNNSHTYASRSDIHVDDIDSDGYNDILYAGLSNDKIAWLKNDGTGSFESIIIDEDAESASAITSYDINNDGNMDIVASYFDIIAVYINDGDENFTRRSGPATQASDIDFADLDGDGIAEILTSTNRAFTEFTFTYFKYPSMIAQTLYSDDITDWSWGIESTDLDADGDVDVFVIANSFYYLWLENTGIDPTSGFVQFTPHIISDEISFANGASAIALVDLNSDERLDVVGVNSFSDTYVWFENLGPLGISGPHSFEIYPNPTQDFIAVTNKEEGDYQIVDLQGQILVSGSLDAANDKIDIQFLNPSVYLFVLYQKGSRRVVRFIKR